MNAAGATHVGCKRRRNEDAYYLGEHLAAVADGMGGHVSGDVASTTIIEAVRAFDLAASPDELATVLGQAVHAASRALQQRIAADPAVKGMGTTLVAVMWAQGRYAAASIGDSRIYRLRRGQLTQLTEDHVYGRLLANAGNVPDLPEKLSRFLDGRPDGRSADVSFIDVRPGERLLLCSDGLSSYVAHDTIRELLSEGEPEQAVEALVKAALDVGGMDNVTVAVLDA